MDFQNHERQEVVNHAEYNGEIGVHHLERADAEQPEQMVQQTVILQNADPCIRAHEHVDPGRQCDDEDEEGAAFARARNRIRRGIAQKQTDNGGQDGDAQRTQQYLDEHRVAEKAREICQRELSLKECRALDGERICDNQQHWDDDEDGNPGDIGIGHRTELFHMLTPSS